MSLPPEIDPAFPIGTPEPPRPKKTFIAWTRDRFLAGLFAVLPLVLTYWLINIVYNFVNGPADRLIRQMIQSRVIPGSDYFIAHQGGTIPGGGFIVTLLLILLIGIVAGHFVGRRVLQAVDDVLLRIPVVKVIYQALRQAVQAVQQIGGDGRNQFRQVAYIPLPGTDAKTFGFVTGKFKGENGQTLVTVFMPHAPSPLTGIIFVIPEEKLEISTALTVEQATKIVISLGLITPGSQAAKGGRA